VSQSSFYKFIEKLLRAYYMMMGRAGGPAGRANKKGNPRLFTPSSEDGKKYVMLPSSIALKK
jgi:hypothetical protein